MAEPITTPFALVILGFIWAAVRLRSVIVGALTMFMVISYVLAVTIDMSIIYFWMSAGLASIGLALAIMAVSV